MGHCVLGHKIDSSQPVWTFRWISNVSINAEVVTDLSFLHQITKLKIDNNPFAKGFRDNGLSRKRWQMYKTRFINTFSCKWKVRHGQSLCFDPVRVVVALGYWSSSSTAKILLMGPCARPLTLSAPDMLCLGWPFSEPSFLTSLGVQWKEFHWAVMHMCC